MRIAAIDQGTTSTRVLVVEPDGRSTIRHSVRHRQHYPQPGWVEHDPAELLANVRDCLEASGRVDTIGIANQGESCLAWDRLTGEPLSPVIVWQDTRPAEIIRQLRAEGVEALTLERAGLPLDSYFSAPKFAWILRNILAAREARERGRLCLGTTDAWFLRQLTGVAATDATTASRTSLLNLQTGGWDAELCRVFGVPFETLPEIRPTAGPFGSVRDAPITAAVVDQQASLYGHGCRHEGDAKITFGTGAFLLALTGSRIVRAPESGLLPTVAWRVGEQTAFAVDGGVFHAGAAIEWLTRLGLLDDLAQLNELPPEPAISRGLAFVPAFRGLACPHWDRTAAPLWIGMSPETSRTDLCQAVLEGVALRTAEVIDAVNRYVPIAARLSIDGGLSRSSGFAQFLADVSGRIIVAKPLVELTAWGCAALAARACEHRLEAPQGEEKLYRPADLRAPQWKEQFALAVERSRAWAVKRSE